jgi:hypothetical protein
MDPLLMALTLDLQDKARKLTQSDDLAMRFAALDMLDYLGHKIDEGNRLKGGQADDEFVVR